MNCKTCKSVMDRKVEEMDSETFWCSNCGTMMTLELNHSSPIHLWFVPRMQVVQVTPLENVKWKQFGSSLSG